jgi:hypothetical protein
VKVYRERGHKSAWFYDDLWAANIYLVWPVDAAKLHAWIKQYFKCDHDCGAQWSGRCIELESKDGAQAYIVALKEWKNNPSSINALAHEMTHVVAKSFGLRGLPPFNDDNSEVYAYTIGSYMQRSLELLNRKK